MKIKTKSKNEKIAATSFLYALGYNYYGASFEDMLCAGSDLMDNYSEDPCVFVEKGNYASMDFCDVSYVTNETYTWSTQFDKIQKILLKNDKVFDLTDEYNAELVDGGLQVGCQFIDFETFDNLVEFANNNR